MDRTTRIALRKLLVKLYEDAREIRQISLDAGLGIGRIDFRGGAENIWHDVLNEAEKVHKLEQLLETIGADRPETQADINALLGRPSRVDQPPSYAPSSAAPRPVANASAAPTTPPVTVPSSPAPVRAIPIDTPRALQLTAPDKQLIGTLFGQATKVVVLSEFTDGRTATRVLLVRATAHDGVEELPAVVKLGQRTLIETEWQATQSQVLDRLPGFAAVSGAPVYLADDAGEQRGALRYAQVGDGIFAVESLSRYSSHATIQDLWQVLANRLFHQLGRLWQATQQRATISFQQRYDAILPVNLEVEVDNNAQGYPIFLNAHYLATNNPGLPPLQPGAVVRLEGFVVTEESADGRTLTLDLPRSNDSVSSAYRLRIQRPSNEPPCPVGATFPAATGRVRATRQSLLQGYLQPHLGDGIDLTQPTVRLSDQRSLPNPLLALPTLLARTHEGRLATIHGDLNLRNILIDPAVRTAHIIDCASARQDHVLHDLLRLERDLLTDGAAQSFFQSDLPPTAIVRFYQQLHCATRGAAHDPGHFAWPTELEPALAKLFVMIATLRHAARDLLAVPGDWAEYYTGLILHLVGALKYRDLDNPAPGQQPKAIAFWAAAALCDLVAGLSQGDSQRCRDMPLRYFDITRSADAATGARDLSFSPETPASSKGVEPATNLESLPSKGLEPPTATDQAPVERRLDVAAPAQATLHRPFSLAVAVRQNDSPRLAINELPVVHSGQAQLEWPADEPFVRVRVLVVAPACTIDGEDSYTFKLYRNLDSVIYYFSLTPKTTGQLTIIVRLYQETDFLGSAQAQTTVSEQVVGAVPLQLHSSAPVTVKRAPVSNSAPDRGQMTSKPPIKILFLAANPLDTVRLSIDEEVRAIQQALRQAEYRIFDIALGPAVRIEDLQDLLLQHQPDILHFSGHGAETNAIILQNAQGNGVQVSGAALGQLFQILKDNLRCIVLNACYTADLAAGLAAVVDCVVGIEQEITDSAALQFATAFYRALGYGRSVQEAFALGQVQINLAGLGTAEALHLNGANPEELRFVSASKADNPTPPSPLEPTIAADTAPSSPGNPPPTTKRQLFVPAKMQLAEALLACPTMANRQSRDGVVNDLPAPIKSNIRRSDTDRVDVVNILTTVVNYANGLEDLITIIRFYEGDSIGMQGVDQLLAKYCFVK